MKTQYSVNEISTFLVRNEHAIPESIKRLKEGHVSQAFSFEIESEKYVCRLAKDGSGFRADQFAFQNFRSRLPIPEVKTIGLFDTDTYYCVSKYIRGKTAISLTRKQLEAALPSIHAVLAGIYQTDIRFSTGYGQIDADTGNAKHRSWKQKLEQIKKQGRQSFKLNAANIGLHESLVDKFFEQYETNLGSASEFRRLFHGDPGFDNVLIEKEKVSGIIDWAQIGYGDWMCDFARLDFYGEGIYGDALTFAKQFGLEYDNLEARKALYWATNALWAIEFADRAKNKSVTQWLQENLESKLISF